MRASSLAGFVVVLNALYSECLKLGLNEPLDHDDASGRRRKEGHEEVTVSEVRATDANRHALLRPRDHDPGGRSIPPKDDGRIRPNSLAQDDNKDWLTFEPRQGSLSKDSSGRDEVRTETSGLTTVQNIHEDPRLAPAKNYGRFLGPKGKKDGKKTTATRKKGEGKSTTTGKKDGKSTARGKSHGSASRQSNVFSRAGSKGSKGGKKRRGKRYKVHRQKRPTNTWRRARTLTYAAGLNDVYEVVVDYQGLTYKIASNVTVTQTGVVSLAAASTMIKSVECNENGSIRVEYNIVDALSCTLQDLFPVGAVLVVSSDVFGECLLGPDTPRPPSGTAEAPFSPSDDGFLVIESVSGSCRNALIRGSIATYFSMFSEGDVLVELVDSTVLGTAEENKDVRHRGLQTGFELSEVKQLGFLEIKASAKLVSRSAISRLRTKWGLFGLELSITVAVDFSLEAEFGVVLKVAKKKEAVELAFLSLPLFGVPPILEKLNSRFGLDLPELKLGLYFELPIIVEFEGNIQKKVGMSVKSEFKSGRKELEFYAEGGWTGISTGVRTLVNEPFEAVPTVIPVADELTGEPVTIELQAYIFYQPKLAFYAQLLTASAGFDLGLELKGIVGLPILDPLEPAMLGTALQFGVCETCHYLRIEGTFKVTNAKAMISFLQGYRRITIYGFTLEIEDYIELWEIEVTVFGNPTLSADIFKICLFREFGDNTITCGKACCNEAANETCVEDTSAAPPEKKCMEPSPTLVPSSTPVPSSTSLPSPTQMPNPPPTTDPCSGSFDPCCRSDSVCCEPGNCDLAGASGDPHLVTFDGLRYSCQGRGEFVLMETTSGVEVQCRFKKKGSLVSLATGVTVSGGTGTPTVQVSIPEGGGSPELFVNGVATNPMIGYEDNEVRVSSANNNFEIFYKTTGLSVYAGLRLPTSFAHFDVRVALPAAFRKEEIRGLLGSTPDDDATNDWMAQDGSVLAVPSSTASRTGREGYDYCTSNWCITNSENSLFVYNGEFDFNFFSGCGEEYPGDIDFSSAPAGLVELCGQNVACLIDGIELGTEGAQDLLEADADLTGASTSSQFRADPSTISVHVSLNIALTVNLTDVSTTVTEIESFAVYRVDSETGQMESTRLAFLLDIGSAIGTDIVAGDSIFSNVIAVRSSIAGETFSFKAIPVVGGVERGDSEYVFTVSNAVQSFSIQSGIGNSTNTSLPVLVPWITDQSNILVDGGWLVNDSGRTIRFNVEDSVECNGSNRLVQSGTATAAIDIPEDYQLSLTIQGIAERVSSTFELMDFFLDERRIVSSRAPGGGGDGVCDMGPVTTTFLEPSPFLLPVGPHTLRITFTTRDNLYHLNAFYELVLIFQLAS